MSLKQEISVAFASGEVPEPERLLNAMEPRTGDDDDDDDALWFSGKSWDDLSWLDWMDHSGAFYALSPSAFIYYLPSILCLSEDRPNEWFAPADSLLNILNRSPVVEYWDTFFIKRLVGLQDKQYEVMKSWLLVLANGTAYEELVDRSFDTVNLLQAESRRVRLLAFGNG